MKRLFAKSVLQRFWLKHPGSKDYLLVWYDAVMKSDWRTPGDIKKRYGTVSILKNGRVVFNIKGGSYRLVARINFKKQWIFIRFIGTHKEYERIDANTI